MAYKYNPIKLLEYCIIAIHLQIINGTTITDKHQAITELQQKALNYAESELIENIEHYEKNWTKNITCYDDLKNKNKIKEMIILREKFKNKIAILWIREQFKI